MFAQRMWGNGISIHAPTWGATKESPAPPGGEDYFNPRTHVGCDSLTSGN